jgi:RteC protein
MNEQWKELYKGLCTETGRIHGSGPGGMEQTESLFKCCLGYWDLCKAIIRSKGFDDDSAEIDFFKLIKPKFTGLLEFYFLVYQYQLFCPAGDAAESAAFADNELRKIVRFRVMHQSFIQYIMGGGTDQDADLFLRRNRPDQRLTYMRPHDMDPALTTAGDWILTLHIGNELYERFLSSTAGPGLPAGHRAGLRGNLDIT